MPTDREDARRAALGDLTYEQANDALSYDPETGVLIWKNRKDRDGRWNGKNAGKEAGSKPKNGNYTRVSVNKRDYLAHRVAFLLMKGRWPISDLDHIDGNKQNNSWTNLREVHHYENMQNTKTQKNNSSGYRGVSKTDNGKWIAKIYVSGIKFHLGRFKSKEDAAAAYREAARTHHKTAIGKGVRND